MKPPYNPIVFLLAVPAYLLLNIFVNKAVRPTLGDTTANAIGGNRGGVFAPEKQKEAVNLIGILLIIAFVCIVGFLAIIHFSTYDYSTPSPRIEQPSNGLTSPRNITASDDEVLN